MLRASTEELIRAQFQSRQTCIKENLACEGCGAHIIVSGRLTCPRCHESLEMHSMQDVICDYDGRWRCQKCQEHGKNPKTLAIGDEVQCRVCPEKTKNKLVMEPFDKLRVKESEMVKTAVTKTESGVTKLTTKEYNELLQQWLKDEKKKKRELRTRLVPGTESTEDIRVVEEETVRVNKRIEALEKAIALRFDPDEFERTLNVPLAGPHY